MAKIVQRAVAVHHPETGEVHWFYPGDKLPAWAEDVVTNPRAFQAERENSGPGDSHEEEPEFEDGPPDYSAMTNKQLELLLEERDLDVRGNKAEKVARLEASDAATG